MFLYHDVTRPAGIRSSQLGVLQGLVCSNPTLCLAYEAQNPSFPSHHLGSSTKHRSAEWIESIVCLSKVSSKHHDTATCIARGFVQQLNQDSGRQHATNPHHCPHHIPPPPLLTHIRNPPLPETRPHAHQRRKSPLPRPLSRRLRFLVRRRRPLQLRLHGRRLLLPTSALRVQQGVTGIAEWVQVRFHWV